MYQKKNFDCVRRTFSQESRQHHWKVPAHWDLLQCREALTAWSLECHKVSVVNVHRSMFQGPQRIFQMWHELEQDEQDLAKSKMKKMLIKGQQANKDTVRTNERCLLALEERIFELDDFPSMHFKSGRCAWQVPLEWDIWHCKDQLTRWKAASQTALASLTKQHETLVQEHIIPATTCPHKRGHPVTVILNKEAVQASIVESPGDEALEKLLMCYRGLEDPVSQHRFLLFITKDAAQWLLEEDYQETVKMHEAAFHVLEQRIQELQARSFASSSGLQIDAASLKERVAILEAVEKELRIGKTCAEQEKKELLEHVQNLRIESAVLKERCAQHESTIARHEKAIDKLEQENRSMKGELSDMRQCHKMIVDPEVLSDTWWHLSARSRDDNTSLSVHNEILGEKEILDSRCDAASQESIQSSWTWISLCAGDHCFLPAALFKVTSSTDFYLHASDLCKGSRVKAYDDKTVLEVACHPEQHEVNELVEIHAGGAVLPVTPDHRVPVKRQETPCIVQAKDLKAGDRIIVNDTYTALTKIVWQPTAKGVPVVKITFKPDMPVPVFMPPPAISTKGHYRKPLRRSGMNKRGQSEQEHVSLPDTAEWWPECGHSIVDVCNSPNTDTTQGI